PTEPEPTDLGGVEVSHGRANAPELKLLLVSIRREKHLKVLGNPPIVAQSDDQASCPAEPSRLTFSHDIAAPKISAASGHHITDLHSVTLKLHRLSAVYSH